MSDEANAFCSRMVGRANVTRLRFAALGAEKNVDARMAARDGSGAIESWDAWFDRVHPQLLALGIIWPVSASEH